MNLPPDHLEPKRRDRGARAPWWRRIAYLRLAAILFCLFVWVAVGRACLSYV